MTGEPVSEMPLYTISEHGSTINPGLKRADAQIAKTRMSITPSTGGAGLEVAFFRKGKEGEEKMIGDDVKRLDAGQGDLEEVADTFSRVLAGGGTPEDIIDYLDTQDAASREEMLARVRQGIKDEEQMEQIRKVIERFKSKAAR